MTVRLLSWAPEYGTAMQAVQDQDADERADPTVEGRWEAVEADPAHRPETIQIIDGVRRTEAHALDEDQAGAPLHALFGTIATGGVRCDASGARVIESSITVRRLYLQQIGGAPRDIPIEPGITYVGSQHEGDTPNHLVSVLTAKMREDEAILAERLVADDPGALTLMDGPLARSYPRRELVGLVKRIHTWYLDQEHRALLSTLRVGQRTPIFRISRPDAGKDRYSWFLQLADLGSGFHPYSSLARLEAPGELPVAEAVRMADQCAAALPRLASSPARDPRAPQNLTPVGALEARLTHRLGSGLRTRRRLAAVLGQAPEAIIA